MEKVIIVNGAYLGSSDASNVNHLLEEGWSVKTVKTVATKEEMSAIFVLEK